MMGKSGETRRRMPAETRRSLFIYNFLFPLVLLALLPGLMARMFRRGNFRANFGQRLGRFSVADRARFTAGEWIWIHSISVGETLLALKLARKIRTLVPGHRIVISVTTSTGFAVAKPQASEWLEVIYNPLDAPWIVRRTLALVRPARLIFVEAVWPNLLAEAARCGVAVSFVPRLSPRSEARFRTFRFFTGPIFRLLDRLAVQEPEDVARWQSLGVDARRIRVTGNAKFDPGEGGAERANEFREILRKLGANDRAPVLLAGSTFPGEERIVAEAFRELRAQFPALFLVLVPRHVERAREVLADLRPLGLRLALRSSLKCETADVLLVDVTGELRDWYYVATVVFMGKSLTAVGGQNPVEPVMARKPVVFGPHMENFAPIVQRWLAADAAVQVPDAAELKIQLANLLADPERCDVLAARAKEIVEIHRGATVRTARALLEYDA